MTGSDSNREAHANATPLSLLVIDLDCFKTINDAFGHLRGDEILAELLGDRHEISESLLGLGNVSFNRKDFQAAETYYRECLEHARAIDDRRRIGESLGNLGLTAHHRGALRDAQRYLLDCGTHFEAIGDQLGLSMAWVNLGSVEADRDNVPVAERYFHDGLRLARSIGALPVILDAVASLAMLRIRSSTAEQEERWLAYVRAHPGCTATLQGTIRSFLASRDVNTSEAAIEHLTLEAIVAEVLAVTGINPSPAVQAA